MEIKYDQGSNRTKKQPMKDQATGYIVMKLCMDPMAVARQQQNHRDGL